jgi:uncharacterized protein
MFRVLAIDGGGIRGVIPAVLLQHIEERSGKRICQMFDLIVGTSTGGILAAGLTVPKSNSTPKYAAADMLDLYAEHGSTIFKRSFWRGVTSVAGAFDEQYSHEPLEKLLKQYLGNKTLTDCLVPIVLTSYDIERREPYLFKTRRAKEKADRNHYLADAARATSAAPTYFEPAKVRSLAKRPTVRHLVDGGVFVNNPSMCALVEALSYGVKSEDIVLVGLGTGVATRTIAYDDATGWGALGWVRPIISVMMDGEADAADYQARQILPDETAGRNQRYFRFDTTLDLALDDMDAANDANIAALKAEAAKIIENQKAEIDRMMKLLVRPAAAVPELVSLPA